MQPAETKITANQEDLEMSPRRSAANIPAAATAIPQRKRGCTTCTFIPRSWRSKILHWTTFSLALTFYLLSVLYAWNPGWVSRVELIGGSPAKALGLLVILSGIANPLISTAIGHAIDVLRGLLIARGSGHNLMDNLPLQPGIGVDGLWSILWHWRLPSRWKPKALAVFRYITMAIVPILAILILTNVETELVFYRIDDIPASRGYGIGTFNATLAVLLNPMTDLTFSTRFKDFLSDSDRSIDITPGPDREECAEDFNSTCRSSYFVPGGVENVAPALQVGKNFTDAGSIQALNQRGYLFEFEDGHSKVEYDNETDCVLHGFVIGAVQICLRNSAPYKLQAYITSCPKELAANALCLSNNTWHSQKGWNINMATYARYATVSYNGLNGTILSHEWTNDTKEAVNISATELLQVFDTLLQAPNITEPFGKALAFLGLGLNKPLLPLSMWEYFQGLEKRVEGDARTNRQAAIGLESILALALYHCQGKDFNELKRVFDSDPGTRSKITKTVGQNIIDLFPSVEPDTDIVPAVLRYNLVIDRSVLLAYIVVAGTTLAMCLAAQTASSCTKLGRRVKATSPFPLFNQICECEMQYYDTQKRILLDDFRKWNATTSKEQLKAAAAVRVVLTPASQVEVPPNVEVPTEEGVDVDVDAKSVIVSVDSVAKDQ